MKLIKLSQSLTAVVNSTKRLIQRSCRLYTAQQFRKSRKFSLSVIKNGSSQSSSIKKNQPFSNQNNKMTQFKQKMLTYIDKRSDVQIINFYNQYKEEFFRKSINLQNLFYQQPQIRHKYLNQVHDTHFFKGFQHTLLALFRKGVIVPGQYKNMRLQTVQQIQKWVFSWIKRKKNYQKAIQHEQTATNDTFNVLAEINQWAQTMKSQKPIF